MTLECFSNSFNTFVNLSPMSLEFLSHLDEMMGVSFGKGMIQSQVLPYNFTTVHIEL